MDKKKYSIKDMMEAMEEYNASDLHIKVDSPPAYRINGILRVIDIPPVSKKQTERMCEELLEGLPKEIKETKKLPDDFTYILSEEKRFRINNFLQCGRPSLAIRSIKTEIPTFKELHLPPILKEISRLNQGLIIVSGATGSGKSTTLAAIIDEINKNRACHILTIEDPIEYMHKDKKAFITQREIGIDVPDFFYALRMAVRQDPDVILIGELRDVDTINTALSAAETGHLVLGTIHAVDTVQIMRRIIEFFPQAQEKQIRTLLSYNLKAGICQKILKRDDGKGMIPAVEIFINIPIIKKLIEEAQENKIAKIMQGHTNEGMQIFNQSLLRLINKKYISEETALSAAPNPESLKRNLRGIFLDTDGGGIIE
jgi:twitching motility protein PilT